MKAARAMGSVQSARLPSRHVAILGLGLMGGSLAMALRGQCGQLCGYDIDAETVHIAQDRQVVDYASTQLDEILPQADLIILATPVNQILSLLKQLGTLHPDPAMVMDIGSTKRQLMQAMQALPNRFDALGGHPICGKEKSSLVNAEASLYQGARFVLCRLPRTSENAIRLAAELVEVIGATPTWMEPEEHDRWIASTSHLPYLVANALVRATPGQAAGLLGPGYLSTTRLAASYAPMLVDVLETNRDMVLPALAEFRAALGQLEARLRDGDQTGLADYLRASAQKHAELIKCQEIRRVPGDHQL